MKEKDLQGHQGDVFFRYLGNSTLIDLLDSDLVGDFGWTNIHSGGVTLVQGETKGLHHQIEVEDMPVEEALETGVLKVYQLPPNDELEGITSFIVGSRKPFKLVHKNVIEHTNPNKHTTINFKPGTYEFRSQRFMDTEGLIRRVID